MFSDDLGESRKDVQATKNETSPNQTETRSQTKKKKRLSTFVIIPAKKRNKKTPTKIGSWKANLSDDEWEHTDSIGKIARKKRKVTITKAKKALTVNLKKEVKQVVKNFDIVSAAEIVSNAIKIINKGEAARAKCENIKDDLNRKMKIGFHVNRIAVEKLAIRASFLGNTTYNKEKCLLLQENDKLRKELEEGKTNKLVVQALVHRDRSANKADGLISKSIKTQKNEKAKTNYDKDYSMLPGPSGLRPSRGVKWDPGLKTIEVDDRTEHLKGKSKFDRMYKLWKNPGKQPGKLDTYVTLPRNLLHPPSVLAEKDWQKAVKGRKEKKNKASNIAQTTLINLKARDTANDYSRRIFRDEGLPPLQRGTFPHQYNEDDLTNRQASTIQGRNEYTGGSKSNERGEKSRRQMNTRKDQKKETKTATLVIDAAKKRILKTTAVTITRGKDAPSYATLLRNARDKVSLNDLGINNSRIKRAVNGGIIIKIPGENMADKANEFVRKLETVIEKEDVVVARPTKRRN